MYKNLIMVSNDKWVPETKQVYNSFLLSGERDSSFNRPVQHYMW